MIEAVRYFLERHYSDFSDGAFLVDLKEAKSLQDIVKTFSKEFRLHATDSETLIREKEQHKMLVSVTNCHTSAQVMLSDLLKEIISKKYYLKLILIADEGHTKFDQHTIFLIKPISNYTKYNLCESKGVDGGRLTPDC